MVLWRLCVDKRVGSLQRNVPVRDTGLAVWEANKPAWLYNCMEIKERGLGLESFVLLTVKTASCLSMEWKMEWCL